MQTFLHLRGICDHWSRWCWNDFPAEKALYYTFNRTAETKPDWANSKCNRSHPTHGYVSGSWFTFWAASLVGRVALDPKGGPAAARLLCTRSRSWGRSGTTPTNLFGDGLFYGLLLHVMLDKGQIDEGSWRGAQIGSRELLMPHDGVWLCGMWVLINQDVHAPALARLTHKHDTFTHSPWFRCSALAIHSARPDLS